MKKSISKDIIFISVNLLLIIIVGIYALIKNKPEYTLNLPPISDIDSVEIVKIKSDKNILIEDYNDIKEIIEILSNKKTKEQSNQDSPTNTKELYTINFIYKEKGSAFLYLYKRKNNYYIEIPYDGIYKLSKTEYNKIISYE